MGIGKPRHAAIRRRLGGTYPDAESDSPPVNLHVVYLERVDDKPPIDWRSGEGNSWTDTEIDTNCGARLRHPPPVEELYEEAGLAYGGVPDQEQLAVDRVCGSHRRGRGDGGTVQADTPGFVPWMSTRGRHVRVCGDRNGRLVGDPLSNRRPAVVLHSLIRGIALLSNLLVHCTG